MPPLQFLLTSLLFNGPLTGPELRRRIQAAGTPVTPATFSRLVRRMELAGYVHVDSEVTPAGRRLRARRYRLTDLALAVWLRTRDFYTAAPDPPPDLEPVVTGQIHLAHLSPQRRRQIADQQFKKQLTRTLERCLHAYKKRCDANHTR